MKNNDIAFDDIKYKPRTEGVKASGIANFLIRKGIVKNEKQASILMILIVTLAISASVFIVYINFFKQPTVQPISPEAEAFYKQQMDASTKSNNK